MKKALTIGLAGAAVAATLSFVAVDLKSESPVVSEAKATENASEPTIVLAQNTVSVMNYERGPRIIIVPQAGDRKDYGNTDPSRASIDRGVYEDDDIAPPPVRTTPRWAPRTETPKIETPAKPRSEPRQEKQQKRVVRHIDMSKPKAKVEPDVEIPQPSIPQPPSPRRAVLSAPPLPAEGPSPIKPTPKFDVDAKAETREKSVEPDAELTNDSPPPGEITADSPPPGYSPPKAPMRDDGYGNKY